MGVYTRCWLGNDCLVETRDDVDADVCSLFSEADKRVVAAMDIETAPHAVAETWRGDLELEEAGDVLVFYARSGREVRDELDLLGYTFETSSLAFAAASEFELRSSASNNPSELNWTLERWLAWWRGTPPGMGSRRSATSTGVDDVPFCMDGIPGFPGPDGLPAIRLLLEYCPGDAELVCDLTGLVLDGSCTSADLQAWGFCPARGSQRTIVLTEGKSDAWILEGALRVLYPHLADRFSFMDFAPYKAEGGTAVLAKLVRSFAAAGVANRVIGLFDNDAAGHEAFDTLAGVSLPARFRVLRLGDTELLRSYPTIGPTGAEVMDVNGRAGGIELYLGRDVLEFGGALSPVQWRGYLPRIGRYQGEVLEKTAIQQRFRAKLDAPPNAAVSDWTELKVVVDQILTAFHELDRRLILERIRDT